MSRRQRRNRVRSSARSFAEPLERRVMLAAGDLDPTFGIGGKVTTEIPNFYIGGAHHFNAMALQADGKIVVAGFTTGFDFVVARYNSNGSLDTGFGGSGVVVTDVGGLDVPVTVAARSDGRIVVAGYSYTSTYDSAFALVRYNADGSLDTTFGGDGKVTTDFGPLTDVANGVAFQPDGKLVAAGYATRDDVSDLDSVLARYNDDGSLDMSFGGGGAVTTDDVSRTQKIDAIALQSDGRIVAAGFSTSNGSGPNYDIELSRYNADGTLDGSFGVSGKTVPVDFGGHEFPLSVAIQSDGRYVLAGQSLNVNPSNFVLFRYTADGSLDTSFGTGGQVVTSFGSGSNYNLASGVAIQSDGKIVAAGEAGVSASSHNFALARYNPDGSLDGSFGSGGTVITEFHSNLDAAYGVAIANDGKIIAAGEYAEDNSGVVGGFALARYDSGIVSTNRPPLADAGGPYVINEG